MKIAVSYKDGEIYEHFGHSEMFAIYDYAGADVDKCTKRLIDCAQLHGHADMAGLMKDNGVDAVICGSMGAEAKSLLLSYGIIPVAGYSGDADTAADMLILGQLPVNDGGDCSHGCGGCSGCGGECGESEDGGCGCGGCH